MRKLGRVCSVLAYIAVFGFFAAGNILTVLVCGGIALLMGCAAHVLNRV